MQAKQAISTELTKVRSELLASQKYDHVCSLPYYDIRNLSFHGVLKSHRELVDSRNNVEKFKREVCKKDVQIRELQQRTDSTDSCTMTWILSAVFG